MLCNAPRYFLGLDLGQAADFSALVALARTAIPKLLKCAKRRYRYEVRGLKRWPLKTAYSQIARDVATLASNPPLAGCTLGIDKTGVGAGVLEIIQAEKPNAAVRPILITAGHEVNPDGAGYRVPKLELVASVTALLDSDRLAIPRTIAEARTLAKELRAFRAKVTAAGNEVMAADWRTRQHDDMVLALAIAAWLGEHTKEAWLRFDGISFADDDRDDTVKVMHPDGRVTYEPFQWGRHIDLRPDAPGWHPYGGWGRF
jgi:hypothetical protein